MEVKFLGARRAMRRVKAPLSLLGKKASCELRVRGGTLCLTDHQMQIGPCCVVSRANDELWRICGGNRREPIDKGLNGLRPDVFG
jgi:hypothetical protein